MFYSTRKKIIFFGIHFTIGWFGLFIEVTWWCNSLLIITRNSVLVQGCSSERGRGTFLFSSSTGTNELPRGGLILCRIMFELRGLLHRVVIENAPFHCSRTSRLLLWLMKRISSQIIRKNDLLFRLSDQCFKCSSFIENNNLFKTMVSCALGHYFKERIEAQALSYISP